MRQMETPLIEDAAEALGSIIQTTKSSIHCGCVGDIGTGFNGNKIITTGGGGALLIISFFS